MPTNGTAPDPGGNREAAAAAVRAGRLSFPDFLRLDPRTVRRIVASPDARPLLGFVLPTYPTAQFHFLRCCPDGTRRCLVSAGPAPAASEATARDLLVRTFAVDLLREKAPPIHESLPWLDWDFDEVARRMPLWRTRLLLVGESSSLVLARCRRTAGVYAVEPLGVIRDYLTRKAARLGLHGVRVLDAEPDSIPLPDRSADLAIVASGPDAPSEALLASVTRVARHQLVVDTRPGQAIDEDVLRRWRFTPERMRVIAARRVTRCWWREAGAPGPA